MLCPKCGEGMTAGGCFQTVYYSCKGCEGTPRFLPSDNAYLFGVGEDWVEGWIHPSYGVEAKQLGEVDSKDGILLYHYEILGWERVKVPRAFLSSDNSKMTGSISILKRTRVPCKPLMTSTNESGHPQP